MIRCLRQVSFLPCPFSLKFQKPGTSSADTTEDSNPAFDIKQARYEVRKLGIKGFQGDQKEEAMTALLVGLGAKVSFCLSSKRMCTILVNCLED